MKRVFKASVHRHIVASLALIFVPASLIYHLWNLPPKSPEKRETRETLERPQATFSPAENQHFFKTSNVTFLWRHKSDNEIGFSRLQAEPRFESPQKISQRLESLNGYRIQYLGKHH